MLYLLFICYLSSYSKKGNDISNIHYLLGTNYFKNIVFFLTKINCVVVLAKTDIIYHLKTLEINYIFCKLLNLAK